MKKNLEKVVLRDDGDLIEVEIGYRVSAPDEDGYLFDEDIVDKIDKNILRMVQYLDRSITLNTNSIDDMMEASRAVNMAEVLKWIQEKLFSKFKDSYECDRGIFGLDEASYYVFGDNCITAIGHYKRKKAELKLIDCQPQEITVD